MFTIFFEVLVFLISFTIFFLGFELCLAGAASYWLIVALFIGVFIFQIIVRYSILNHKEWFIKHEKSDN